MGKPSSSENFNAGSPELVRQLEQETTSEIQTNLEEASEVKPFYALDENKIRSRVAAAFDQAEKAKAPLLISSVDVQPEERENDQVKALLMADAEDPYRMAAKAKLEEMYSVLKTSQVVGEKIRRDSVLLLVNFLRNPIKILKAAKLVTEEQLLNIKGWSAAQIVGSQYDRMLAAASPFQPKLEPTIQAKAGEVAGNPEAKQLIERLRLDRQLEEQAMCWQQAGVVIELSDGKLGTMSEGREILLPSLQDVAEALAAQPDRIKEKAAQGFTRLLLVPGLSADALTLRLQDRVVAHFQGGELRATDGHSVELDEFKQVSAPKQQFELVEPPPKTRPLQESESFWQVFLVKNLPQLPAKPEELVSLGGRAEFLTGFASKPATRLSLLETSPQLRYEEGFTLEMWLSYALTQLERDGELIDSKGGTMLLGSYEPRFLRRYIPWVGWVFGEKLPEYNLETRTEHPPRRQIKLQIGAAPANGAQFAGARTGVRVI
jgi:hypothetical protein